MSNDKMLTKSVICVSPPEDQIAKKTCGCLRGKDFVQSLIVKNLTPHIKSDDFFVNYFLWGITMCIKRATTPTLFI